MSRWPTAVTAWRPTSSSNCSPRAHRPSPIPEYPVGAASDSPCHARSADLSAVTSGCRARQSRRTGRLAGAEFIARLPGVMTEEEQWAEQNLTVLVVDDDFRVANMHAGIVDAMPGFTAGRHRQYPCRRAPGRPGRPGAGRVYLPDGSGIDFVRELRGDSMILTAATEADTIRAAMAAGAVSYLVKPFATTELAARLSGYARYRKICPAANLSAADVDSALDALRPKVIPVQSPTSVASPTKKLVLQAFAHRPLRCPRPRWPRRSGFRGRRRNGTLRRWRRPGRSAWGCGTGRRVGPSRSSPPPTPQRGRGAERGGHQLVRPIDPGAPPVAPVACSTPKNRPGRPDQWRCRRHREMAIGHSLVLSNAPIVRLLFKVAAGYSLAQGFDIGRALKTTESAAERSTSV